MHHLEVYQHLEIPSIKIFLISAISGDFPLEPQVEAIIRLGSFFAIFLVMAIAEILFPRSPLRDAKTRRWRHNLGLVLLDSLVVRLLFFRMAAVGIAESVATAGFGLFNLTHWPFWIEVLLTLLLLDLAIYAQHVLFHKIPLFWRLHRVHHIDLDVDVTTALRFHPIEIVLSMLLKMVCVALLGAPAIAVVLFEVILNGTAMFNHSNLRLPASLDRLLRALIVTPDMHQIHHSTDPAETDSNYGFNLSLWDRIFHTYCHAPALGHNGIILGLKAWQQPLGSFLQILVLPLAPLATSQAKRREKDDLPLLGNKNERK